jgi:hypothetical protein
MNGFLEQLRMTATENVDVQLVHAAYLFAHAVLNGAVLMFLCWRMSQAVKTDSGKRKKEADFITSSANVLFLCVGMTAVMILVNDNIARAFAIGAAVALVRFRIKMAGKFLGAALFYAVLVGMACGVSRVDLAWAVTLVFAMIVESLGLARKLMERRKARPSSELRLVDEQAPAHVHASSSLTTALLSSQPVAQESAE